MQAQQSPVEAEDPSSVGHRGHICHSCNCEGFKYSSNFISLLNLTTFSLLLSYPCGRIIAIALFL